MTATRMDEAIDEIVRRIVEAVHPDKIILFGSHARGEAREDSDVDLLVVGPSDEPNYERTGLLYSLLGGMGVSKDILWATPEELDYWRDARSHVFAVAQREGRVLYAR